MEYPVVAETVVLEEQVQLIQLIHKERAVVAVVLTDQVNHQEQVLVVEVQEDLVQVQQLKETDKQAQQILAVVAVVVQLLVQMLVLVMEELLVQV